MKLTKVIVPLLLTTNLAISADRETGGGQDVLSFIDGSSQPMELFLAKNSKKTPVCDLADTIEASYEEALAHLQTSTGLAVEQELDISVAWKRSLNSVVQALYSVDMELGQHLRNAILDTSFFLLNLPPGMYIRRTDDNGKILQIEPSTQAYKIQNGALRVGGEFVTHERSNPGPFGLREDPRLDLINIPLVDLSKKRSWHFASELYFDFSRVYLDRLDWFLKFIKNPFSAYPFSLWLGRVVHEALLPFDFGNDDHGAMGDVVVEILRLAKQLSSEGGDPDLDFSQIGPARIRQFIKHSMRPIEGLTEKFNRPKDSCIGRFGCRVDGYSRFKLPGVRPLATFIVKLKDEKARNMIEHAYGHVVKYIDAYPEELRAVLKMGEPYPGLGDLDDGLAAITPHRVQIYFELTGLEQRNGLLNFLKSPKSRAITQLTEQDQNQLIEDIEMRFPSQKIKVCEI